MGDDVIQPRDVLTKTELEILDAIAGGLAPKEIAYSRGISQYTVADHMVAVREKLAARTTAHAAALWARTMK